MDTEKIFCLNKRGKSSKEISKELNEDKREIEMLLIDNLQLSNKAIITKEQLKFALNKYYEKQGIEATAKELNVSAAGIRKYFKKANIELLHVKYFDKDNLTTNLINQIVEDFNRGIPAYQLAKKYNWHKNAIADLINQNGGNTTLPSFDINTFDIIDTEEKAYWLGFLFADGCVETKRSHVNLDLQILDVEHLIKFKNFVKSSNNVTCDLKQKHPRCRFSLSNKHFKNSLINLNCTPKKSLTLKFPTQIKEEFYIPLIRGYFDGDGCLTYAKKTKTLIRPCCGFMGTFEFLTVIKNILEKNNIKCCKLSHPKEYKYNTWTFQISAKSANDFLNLIYNQSKIHLNRKFLKYNYFSKHNFAVLMSDYQDYNRAISVKAKSFLKQHFNVDLDDMLIPR
ncbi:MAG: hypothetical protein KBT03_10290 [Bacteroidales bacterium]|nr:hypothetical protein [Candidatus Scybalousia scybalohippi]